MRDLFEERKHKNTEQKLLLEILKKLEELNQRVSELETEEKKGETSETAEQKRDIESPIETEEIPEEHSFEEPKVVPEDNYIILGAPKGKERRHESIQALQQDTFKEVSKNRKHIIKEKIMSHTIHSRTTPLELKKVFVDTYKYCSKATFYRYLNELEDEGKINYISINNKKYIYPLNEQTNEI